MVVLFTEILLELSARLIQIILGLVVSDADSLSEIVELSDKSPLVEEIVVTFQLLS